MKNYVKFKCFIEIKEILKSIMFTVFLGEDNS